MSKKVCLIRTNDGQMPLVDVLTVPDEVVAGPTVDAENRIYALIRSVSAEYARAHAVAAPMEPVDFLNLPSDFLAAHGIEVEPIDVPVSMTIDMNEIVFDPDGDGD